jgi:ligand-binding sensor domain-containing protein/two-component sensor histidine kinase
MPQRIVKFLILFNCICLCSSAQQVSFIKYTVYDGLVANPIRCIYQDSKGFIWIGTYDGLSRYDGYKFTNYTSTNGLSHNFINSIIEVNGKLLVAENNGAIDVFKNNIIQKGYKLKSAVNSIKPYKDRLLLSTDVEGFFEYKNDTIISVASQTIRSSLGNFISISEDFLLSDGIDRDLFLYKKDFSIQASFQDPSIHFFSFLRDSKKRIWACTSKGLKLLKIETGEKAAITFASLPSEFNFEFLNNSVVTSMVEQEDGAFWISTWTGLVRLFPNGNFIVYNEKDGLPSAKIDALLIDKEKNIWIGTSLGLAKWVSKNNVVFFNTETQDFRNDVITIVNSGDQKIILKTDHGLQYFNFYKKEFKNIPVPGTDPNPITISGTLPLLIYYHGNIGVLDNRRNIVIPLVKLDTILTGVFIAQKHPNGTILLGTFSGVYAVYKTSVKRIIQHRITSLAIDMDGFVWAGTWKDGLFRISVKNDQESYDVVNMSTQIKEKEIRGIYSDSKTNIWIGTRYGGAFCLTPKSNNTYDIQHFNRQSGLMSDWVLSFAETLSGDVWVGSYYGLDKLVKLPSGYRIFNFSKAANFFAEIKKIIATDDYWICVANAGIAIFKDENLQQTPPLQATILSTTLGLRDDKLTIDLPTKKISLKPDQNAARFEFSALGFINERQILYSYRLKGSSDSSWSKPESIHEASYASLYPGDYTFEVKTVGWNGEYSLPASFSFFIATPFWKQWWFIGLGVLIILIFFYSLYKYRIRQILRLQNVRNNIATDLHDDIGSSLTNISILSELSSKNLSQPEKAQPFLQRISEEVHASSQAMDDIIWSVNSRNDSLQETIARMRRYAAELFDNSETDCHLQLAENSGNKKLSMEQRRDVYLIYKEALTNIHKHAYAKNVWINVEQNQNHLFMQIKDDGKGFDTNLVTHRNGLKNLGSRVEKWHGKIQIRSEENKGTNIEIKIPLKD